MRKLPILAIAGVLATGVVAGSALASDFDRPCTSAPRSEWLPMDQIQAKVEAQGYKVRKAKLKKACGEIYALDKNGGRVELFVDPTSGEIVGRL
jgi:hypothetical protein